MKNIISPPVPITPDHDLNLFDCGILSLNEWLKKRALRNAGSGASRTYVVTKGKSVIGYYCLAAGAVGLSLAPRSLRRNMPDPIPVLVLGRLAIHKDNQNQGLGKALLRDATLRSLEASKIVGAKALLVHALSESAKRFYLSCGFVESPIQPMTLCLSLLTAREAVLHAKKNH